MATDISEQLTHHVALYRSVTVIECYSLATKICKSKDCKGNRFYYHGKADTQTDKLTGEEEDWKKSRLQ